MNLPTIASSGIPKCRASGSPTTSPKHLSASGSAGWKSRARGEAPAVLPSRAIDRWRELWRDAQRDTPWMDRHTLRDARRREALPEIAELVTQFLDTRISLAQFRETFDHKQERVRSLRPERLSGAMFLNKLVKHLPDPDEVTAQLRQALPKNRSAPSSRPGREVTGCSPR
jgi:hypothetical protein